MVTSLNLMIAFSFSLLIVRQCATTETPSSKKETTESKATINWAPDASKVSVSGPGIEHGFMPNFQSRFIVETKGAGAGQLAVRVTGPTGNYLVEIQRESQQDRTLLCRYNPNGVGDYVVSIRWSGEDVRGSPFQVKIFETQADLERFVDEQTEAQKN